MYPSNQQINKSLGVISQDLHILKLTPSPPSSGFLRPTIRDLGIIRSFLLKFCSLRVEPHIIWFRLFYGAGKIWIHRTFTLFSNLQLKTIKRSLAKHQGDINYGASSKDEFILNYFLSNFFKFPLKSSFPPSPAGRLEQLMSPCLTQWISISNHSITQRRNLTLSISFYVISFNLKNKFSAIIVVASK